MVCSDGEQEGRPSPSKPRADARELRWPTEDNGFAESLIRQKSRRLARQKALRPSDQEEVEQQLLVQLWTSLPHFNRRKGSWHAYATTVVCRAGSRILRDELAPKRDRRRTVFLNSSGANGEEPSDLDSDIDSSVAETRFGRWRRDDRTLAELSMDLEELTRQLPEHWRTLLELRRSTSMQGAANEMGVPRTTLNDWMVQIRRRFEKSDVQDYLAE